MIATDSRNAHGAISDRSVSGSRIDHIGKGREGNRKGSRSPIHRLLTGGLAAGMDDAYGGDS